MPPFERSFEIDRGWPQMLIAVLKQAIVTCPPHGIRHVPIGTKGAPRSGHDREGRVSRGGILRSMADPGSATIRRAAGVVLCALLGACSRGSPEDLTGPPVGPPEGPASPVFEYVRQMIDDPWFTESLPGQLTNAQAVAPLRAVLVMQLRTAIETRDPALLDAGLESVRAAAAAYRAGSGFDPREEVTLSVFDLFVAQAQGIRDGEIAWSPLPLLARDGG